MDIPPVEPATVHPSRAGVRVPEQEPVAPAPAPGPVAEPAGPPAHPKKLTVETQRREDGVQIVTLVDSRTGEAICSVPAEQVIRVVDRLLWQNARRQHDGDR